MKKVSKRGGFSDRNAIKPENVEIQLHDFDKRTRVQLQNMISKMYSAVYDHDLYYGRSYIQDFIRFVLGTVYSETIDTRKTYDDDPIIKMINETIFNGDYDEVLTLIEALVQYWDSYLKDNRGYQYYDKYNNIYHETSIYEVANIYFEQEYVGYRFVDGIIVPISNSYEVETINETLKNEYQPVYDHISKANKLIADREKPDYENSIKESISAVEAICEIITQTKGKEATLGNMLKKLEDSGVEIHKGLKSAFNILGSITNFM